MRLIRPIALALLLLAPLRQGAAQPPPPGQPAEAALPSRAVGFPGQPGETLRGLLVLPPEGVPRGVPVIALHGCAGLGGPDRPLASAAAGARLGAAPGGARPPGPVSRQLRQPRHHRGLPRRRPGGDAGGAAARRRACRGGLGADPALGPGRGGRRCGRGAAGGAGGVLLIGWSHGGSTALAAVQAPVPAGLIRAAVALYPGCRRIGEATPAFIPAAPVLMLLGADDDWTPARFCRALAAGVPAGAGPVEVVAYPGAWHGFDQPDLPVRVLSGLAGTRSGTAHMGTDAAARADGLARVRPSWPGTVARRGDGAAPAEAAPRQGWPPARRRDRPGGRPRMPPLRRRRGRRRSGARRDVVVRPPCSLPQPAGPPPRAGPPPVRPLPWTAIPPAARPR